MDGFKNKVLDIIENMQERKDESRFWHSVFKFLQESSQRRVRTLNQEFEAKILLVSLLFYGSKDVTLISKIIRRYTLWLYTMSREHPIFSRFLACSLYTQMKFVLSSGKANGIIYYKEEISKLDSMNLSIEAADEDFALCLNKYGLYSRCKVGNGELRKILSIFLQIWSYIQHVILNETITTDSCYWKAKEFLAYICTKNDNDPEELPKKRINFILKILNAVILKIENEPLTEKYVKCFKMFFCIIPEPYVSNDEVKDVLSFLLKGSRQKEEVINMFVDIYHELFDLKSPVPYIPRSLKHLTRCVVRDNIVKSSNTIPNAVDTMCIPENLKHLLLGASE